MAVQAYKLAGIVTADTSEGERKIRGFVEKQAQVIDQGFSGMAKAMGLAATAVVARRVGEFAVETAKLAVANAKVETSFKDMASTAGESSDEMLATLKSASSGTISEYDLMLSANRAMTLGVADNAREMAELLQVARQRGQAMGLSTQQAFNDIVTGLGRGSALILDNLGIVVDLDEAYGEYAISIGKVAEELSEAEKKQALVNSAMRQSGSGGAQVLVDQFERMNAAADNLKVAMGEAFGPMVIAGAKAIADALNAARDPDAQIGMYGGLTANQINDMQTTDAQRRSEAMEAKVRAEEQAYKNLTVAISAAAAADELRHKENAAAWAERGESIKEEIAGITDALMSDLSFGQMDTLNTQLTAFMHAFEHVARTMDGDDQALYGTEKMLLRVEEIVGVLTDDMATVEEITAVMGGNIGKSFAGLLQAKLEAAQLREEMEATAEANELVYDGWNRMAGIVGDVQRQLYGVIGESAFDNFDEYEQQLWDVFNAAIDGGRTTEEAFWLTEQAADALVTSVAELNGGTLDDVAAAALRAEQQLWGTAAAAEAVLALVDQSRNSVNSMFLGAVGQGFTGASAQSAANAVNAEREQFIQNMAAIGVPLEDATFALAEFDAEVRDGIGAVTSAYREQQKESRKAASSTKAQGDAAKRAADGLGELESALGRIPGLFDTTQVTDQDMRLAELGMYQNKPDEYLRRLRDEMLNGRDWEGVDLETAAESIGWDPETARANAQLFIDEFTAAWNDSSLFADPANIDKFLDMEAIQASLERQQDAAQGEKNLKALFGVGDSDDVNAIAALGLDIQSGLSGWLLENGMEDAGARLADALAGGLQTDDLGAAAAGGMSDFVQSAQGQDAFYDIGQVAGGAVGQGITDRILADLAARSPNNQNVPNEGEQMPPTSPSWMGGNWSSQPQNGGVTAQAVGGAPVTLIQNNVIKSPIEAEINARRTADYIRRRQR